MKPLISTSTVFVLLASTFVGLALPVLEDVAPEVDQTLETASLPPGTPFEALLDGALEHPEEGGYTLAFGAVEDAAEGRDASRAVNLGPEAAIIDPGSSALSRVTTPLLPDVRLEELRGFAYHYRASSLPASTPAYWGHYLSLDRTGDGTQDACLVYRLDTPAVAAEDWTQVTHDPDTRYWLADNDCNLSAPERLPLSTLQQVPGLDESVVLSVTLQVLTIYSPWPGGQDVWVDDLSLAAVATLPLLPPPLFACPGFTSPPPMGEDPVYAALCATVPLIDQLLRNSDNGNVTIRKVGGQPVDADQDGRPDIAHVRLVPASGTLSQQPDPGCVQFQLTKGSTNFANCKRWPESNGTASRSRDLFLQLDYFFNDKNASTPDEPYKNLPPGEFDLRIPGLMLYEPTAGARQTLDEDTARLASNFRNDDYDLALYTPQAGVDGGGLCVACIDVADHRIVFDERLVAQVVRGGLLDLDTTPQLGTGPCLVPVAGACDNSIPEGLDYDGDLQSDATSTMLLVRVGPTAKGNLDSTVVAQTRDQWSDRAGLDLSTIHVKRSGDDVTARPDPRYDRHSNIDDDDSTDADELLCGSNPTNPYADCEDFDGDRAKNAAEPGTEQFNPLRLTLTGGSGAAPLTPTIEYFCLSGAGEATQLKLGDVDHSGGISSVEQFALPASKCDRTPRTVTLGPAANATQAGPYLNRLAAARAVALYLNETRGGVTNSIQRSVLLSPSSPPLATLNITGDGGAQPVVPTIMASCGVTTGSVTSAVLNLGDIDADGAAEAAETVNVASSCGPDAFEVDVPYGYLNTGTAARVVTVSLTVNSNQPRTTIFTDTVTIPAQATPNLEVVVPDAAQEAPYSPTVTYRCRLPAGTSYVSAQLSLGDVDHDGTTEASEILAIGSSDCDDAAHEATLPGPYQSTGQVQRDVTVALTLVTNQGQYGASDQVHIAGFAPAVVAFTVPAASQEAPYRPAITFTCSVPAGDSFESGSLNFGDVDDDGGNDIIPLNSTHCLGTLQTPTIPGIGYRNDNAPTATNGPGTARATTATLTITLVKARTTIRTGIVNIAPNARETGGTLAAVCIEGNCPGSGGAGANYKVQFTYTEPSPLLDAGQSMEQVTVAKIGTTTGPNGGPLSKDPDGKWRGNITFLTSASGLRYNVTLKDNGGRVGQSSAEVKIPGAVVVNAPPSLKDNRGTSATPEAGGDSRLAPMEQPSQVPRNVTMKFFASVFDKGAAGRIVNGANAVDVADPPVNPYPRFYWGQVAPNGTVPQYAFKKMARSGTACPANVPIAACIFPAFSGHNTTDGEVYEAQVDLVIGRTYGYYFETKDGGSAAPVALGPTASRRYVTLNGASTPIALARLTIDDAQSGSAQTADQTVNTACSYDPDEDPQGVERFTGNPRGCRDEDGDAVPNESDNCETVANANQADGDGDGIGDACDPDLDDGPEGDQDGDQVLNQDDNCPTAPNADQDDLDEDGLGDACDLDRDGDGFNNTAEDTATPPSDPGDPDSVPNDVDGDGVPNADDDCPKNPTCTNDADLDGDDDSLDNCPTVANADQADADGDEAGDACDAFPNDPDESLDSDLDGIGDNADNCPADSNANQADGDGDGIGNACDPDLNDGPTGDQDGDTVVNEDDNCPDNANTNQKNIDGDDLGDVCDPDRDGDLFSNDEETGADPPSDPDNPRSTPLDTDGDGAPNELDPDTTVLPDPDQVINNPKCFDTLQVGDPDCGRFDSGRYTGPVFLALNKTQQGGVPDPASLLPGSDLDKEDPHDTDGDGNLTEFNGQVDLVERFIAYHDVDELEADDGDPYDGTNGVTLYVYEPKAQIFNNPRLRAVLRVGDVDDTDFDEVLVLEEYASGAPTRVTCIVQGTRQPDGVSPSPTLFVYQGAQAFRATEAAPCGASVASDNFQFTMAGAGALGGVVWNDDKRDGQRDGTSDNGDAAQKSKDDVAGFKYVASPDGLRQRLILTVSDTRLWLDVDARPGDAVWANATLARYDNAAPSMPESANSTTRLRIDLQDPLLSSVEECSKTSSAGATTCSKANLNLHEKLNDPTLDRKVNDDDAVGVGSNDGDGDGAPDNVTVTLIDPTTPAGCINNNTRKCNTQSQRVDVPDGPDAPSFEDGECLNGDDTTFNICNSRDDEPSLMRKLIGPTWPGIRIRIGPIGIGL